MDILEAIESRKSIGKVKQDPVDKVLIEQILECGTRAPNHHTTEPWRFFVMTGEGRRVLGDAYTDIALQKLEAPSEDERLLIKQAQQAKAHRAPVVIAIVASFSGDDEVQKSEDRAATHAAIENMLLAAHGLGLGAIWRTGAPAYHPRIKQAFNLGENEELVGLVYVGYTDLEPLKKPRKSVDELTTWLS